MKKIEKDLVKQKKEKNVASDLQTEVITYKTNDEKIKIEVYLLNETIWLTQAKMSELFEVDRTVITKHLKNIYSDDELKESATCAIFARRASDGKVYDTKFYNLDAIIAVGYRVNSKRATQFRIWATDMLKELLIKGFTMDDKDMKTIVMSMVNNVLKDK